MFLGQSEIIALTGRQKYKAQRAALNAMGITCKVRPDGSIAVLRAVVEKELGVMPTHASRKSKEPNWGAVNA